MPNQRKKGKVIITAWVSADLKRRVQALAVEYGIPVSSVMSMVLRERVEEYHASDKRDGGEKVEAATGGNRKARKA